MFWKCFIINIFIHNVLLPVMLNLYILVLLRTTSGHTDTIDLIIICMFNYRNRTYHDIYYMAVPMNFNFEIYFLTTVYYLNFK